MEKTLNATAAKTHFGASIREASEKGQTVIVERSGVARVAREWSFRTSRR